MLAWLILRPRVFAGLGVLALVASLWAAWWWTTRDLKRDLATTRQELKTTQEDAATAAAKASQDLEREAVNRKDQQAAIDRQNQRINGIAARAREAEATAAIVSLRQLQAADVAAAALRAPTTTVPAGDMAMNDWLRRRFTVTP